MFGRIIRVTWREVEKVFRKKSAESFRQYVASTILVFSFLMLSTDLALAQNYPWLAAGTYKPDQTIEHRISPPAGFTRVAVPAGSYAEWLRRLPLKPDGAPVLRRDGSPNGDLNRSNQFLTVI